METNSAGIPLDLRWNDLEFRKNWEEEFRKSYVEDDSWYERVHPSYKTGGRGKNLNKNLPKFYVGKSGTKYTYSEYCNFGSEDRGRIKDLPPYDYPYTFEY